MLKDITPQPMIVTIGLLALALGYAVLARRARKHLPPGPKGLPILGNLLQIPYQHLASYFRSLLEKYGDLVYLNIVGIPILLIGDISLAKEILERRAGKFSSRPAIPYMRDSLDPDDIYWGVSPVGEYYAVARRLTAGIMSLVRTGVTEPLHQFETLLTVQHFLNGEKDWYKHMERLAISTTLTAAFGAHCPNGDEPALTEAQFVVNELTLLAGLTGSITNVFPFLNLIPGPMPWRTRAEAFRRRHDKFFSSLIHHAVSGKAVQMNTWAAYFADENKPEGDQSRLSIQFIAAAYETTVTTLKLAVLAFIMHPQQVVKAQKQIDGVVGPNRLPTFADRPNMPYVEALLREILRWRPAVRNGIPHLSTADDIIEHNGVEYFIPSGTIVFALPWAIEHNSARYRDPERFDPERFLDDTGALRTDYETSAFGFGRRMCPGVPFAERSIWIAIAMLLWTFNIEKAKDPESGTVTFQYTAGDEAFKGDVTNAPHEFPVVFSPRSSKHEEVARQEWEWCEKDLNAILPASVASFE